MALSQQSLQVLKNKAVEDRLQKVVEAVERTLDLLLPLPTSRLHEAIRYAVLGGGKRIRSYVLYEAARLFDVSEDLVLKVAAALEVIQGYSLVHDDLPAMDNADLRRGKPSCHKAYGEATAILVGDALIPLAFEYLAKLGERAEIKIELIEVLAKTIGSQGLVAGQMRDLGQEGKLIHENDILEMERLKTGVLFSFAAEAGAILGNASSYERQALKDYGLYLGEAFQMRDDLLDGIGSEETLGKPSGQDAQKLTFFSLLGPERLFQKTEEASLKAVQSIDIFGEKATSLKALAAYALHRVR